MYEEPTPTSDHGPDGAAASTSSPKPWWTRAKIVVPVIAVVIAAVVIAAVALANAGGDSEELPSEDIGSVVTASVTPEPQFFVMPYFVGMTVGEAQEALSEVSDIELDDQGTPGASDGGGANPDREVCEQYPPAGTQVYPGDLVAVTSTSPGETCPGEETPEPEVSATPGASASPGSETIGQAKAREEAESYLKHMAFSRSGLIVQLEYEEFSNKDATYAVDSMSVDWDAEALEAAQGFVLTGGISYDGMVGVLEQQGFTEAQATYGADNVDADWDEQAVIKARWYLETGPMSRDELIDLLLFHRFTQEQADYGADQAGL